jgi:hypothetical protein
MAALTKAAREQFLSIACQLSPENLCCDGEAPMSYVRKRVKELHKQWANLEQVVGRKVTEDELYTS